MKFKFPTPPGGKLDTTGLLDKMFPAIAFWQVVFLIAVTVLVSMWNLDVTREFVFDFFEEGRQERAVMALTDPSDTVAADACYALLSAGNSTYYAHIADTLYRRPQASFACLGRSAEDTQSGAPSQPGASQQASPSWPDMTLSSGADDLVPNYVLVASTLGSRWMSDLIGGSDNTCRTALNARRALDLARVDSTYRMMSCALGADSAEVRQCCVTQLGGQEAFSELLDWSDRVPLIPASFDYRALVGSAFPEVPLASELLGRQYQRWEAEIVAPDSASLAERGEERFGNLQYNVQDWVVEVGCSIHYNLPSRGLVPAAFVPLVESAGCGPTTPPWAGMYSPQSWSEMCTGMYDRRRKMGATPREAICGSLATSTVGRSITMAHMIVISSINNGTQLPGVQREKIEFSGDNFGGRLVTPQDATKRREREEKRAFMKGDPFSSSMHQ